MSAESRDTKSAETESYQPEITEGEGYRKADCGKLEIGGAAGEMFAVPDELEIEIEGWVGDEAPGVHMTLQSPRNEHHICVQNFLSPDEARQIAARLQAAADVADESDVW